MKVIYKNILNSINQGEKLLAVLIDPDKIDLQNLQMTINKLITTSAVTHIFVGGSIVEENITDTLVEAIKEHTNLPVLLFPGDVSQISEKADALLFLSLISGRNPEYLINKQVEAVTKLRKTNLDVIPTGYILVESGNESAVQVVSKTLPLSRGNVQHIVDTAKAGELLGMKLIYLEAGSGALHPINNEIICSVKEELNLPLIVGGGIRTKEQLDNAFQSGADMIVIGTAFEEDESFFDKLE
jgi:putative glycerol-1-phosphate prenyltransferase